MKRDGDYYVLESGRRVYSNRGILGIDPLGEVFEGYDGGVVTDGRDLDIATTPDEWRELAAWTPEERAEVADEMIRRWTAFKTV
jgi:hypothetical protein